MARQSSVSFFIVFLAALLVLASMYFLTTARPVLALAPTVLLVIVAFFLAVPRVAYYAIIFLIPLAALRSVDGIKLHWVLAAFLILIALMQMLLSKRIPERLLSNFWPWIFFLLVWCAISATFSSFFDVAVKNTVLLGAGLMFAILGFYYLKPLHIFKELPAVIVASISLSSLFSVVGYVFNVSLFIFADNGEVRGQGATSNPNVMAMTVIFAVPFLSYYLIHAKGFLRKSGVLLLVAINLGGLMSTYSRSGALLFCVVVLLLVLVNRRRMVLRHLGLYIFAISAAFLVIALAVPSSYWTRQSSKSYEGDKSINRRWSYLHVGARALMESPLVGHGMGTFENIYSDSDYAWEFSRTDDIVERLRQAHNTYVEFLVGLGLPGLVFWLIIIWRMHTNFLEGEKKFKEAGLLTQADMVVTYRVALYSLLLFFLMLSDSYNKYFYVLIACASVFHQITLEKIREIWPESKAPQ